MGSWDLCCLSDAHLEVCEGLFDVFAGEAGRLGAGDSFSGGRGPPLGLAAGGLGVALGLEHDEDLFGFGAINFERLGEVARGPGQRPFGVFEETEGGLRREGGELGVRRSLAI